MTLNQRKGADILKEERYHLARGELRVNLVFQSVPGG